MKIHYQIISPVLGFSLVFLCSCAFLVNRAYITSSPLMGDFSEKGDKSIATRVSQKSFEIQGTYAMSGNKGLAGSLRSGWILFNNE